MNNQKVLLLSTNEYDFNDKDTGNRISGITCWVLPLESKSDQYTNGIKPVKYSLSSELSSLFNSVELPAVADMTFSFDFNRNRIVPDTFENFSTLEVGEIVG